MFQVPNLSIVITVKIKLHIMHKLYEYRYDYTFILKKNKINNT